MPPKKQRKLDKDAISHRATKPSVKSSVKSGKKQKVDQSKKRKKVQEPVDNPDLLRPSSPILQAASGAGIKSTAQLKELTRTTRSKAKQLCEPEPVNAANAVNNQSVLNAETEHHSTETRSSYTSSDSSSSESDSELEMSEGSSDIQPDDPVKRKIPFDRSKGQFESVQLSPASLENGKDVRDLGKLQDILLTNPEAFTAIDSMLQVIKAMRTDNSGALGEHDGGRMGNDNQRQTANDRQLPPPPPLPNQADTQSREGRRGMSETTVYTHAVPSASPSQQLNQDLGICMDRFGVSTNLNQADVQPITSTVENSVIHQIVSDPSALLSATNADHHGQTSQCDDPVQLERQAAKERTEQMVLEAERQKLMLEKPIAGNKHVMTPQFKQLLDNPGSSDLSCDDNLFGLSVHLDDLTIFRIESGEFMDFSKLIPTDKVVPDPDDNSNRMQLITQDGKLGVAPFVDKDAITINSYKRWEIAFDVYAGVYTRAHPRRGPEMLEYKHIIRNASETYIWSNVYDYDKIHRRHMGRNPGRTWAKKHKDVWTDKVKIYRPAALSGASDVLTPGKKRKPCRFFNKNGKCMKGANCEFDHKCAFCGLFGHGKYNCRKLAASKKDNNSNNSSMPSVTKDAQ